MYRASGQLPQLARLREASERPWPRFRLPRRKVECITIRRRVEDSGVGQMPDNAPHGRDGNAVVLGKVSEPLTLGVPAANDGHSARARESKYIQNSYKNPLVMLL